ncbi:MAG: peptidoglycan editing factor PgeF [Acidobacteriota bacterium]
MGSSRKPAASTAWLESPEAISAVDDVLAAVGLHHGTRSTRTGSWAGGERVRSPKSSAPKAPAPRASSAGLVQIPAWSKYPWLRAAFSTRQGGVSTIYTGEDPKAKGELNLGWTKEDAEANTAANRKAFLRAATGNPKAELAAIRQFHSSMVRFVEPGHGPLTASNGRAVLRGDALMTNLPNVILGVQTADCVPVLIADTRRRVVAAFHAGWRGTLARVVESGIGTMRLHYGSQPKDLVAAIGPAIGQCCFAVGEEVRFEFESQFSYAPTLFTEVYDSDPIREKYPLLFLTARAPGHSNIGPQIHLDLFEANRRQLLDAGVPAKNVTVVGECTACTRLRDGRRKYFSHRGEHGFTGRMLSVIGINQEK